MSTVAPKLLFCSQKHCQIPVWEIVTKEGDCIYYERVHREGLRPVGTIHDFHIGDTSVDVIGCVKVGRNQRVQVLKERNGYHAPESWYESIPEHSF